MMLALAPRWVAGEIMNLNKALGIVDAKVHVSPQTLKSDYRDIVRRSMEDMFSNGIMDPALSAFRVKEKLNGWLNEKADQYLSCYCVTLPSADIEDFDLLEHALHEHFLKSLSTYYSEACHCLAKQGRPEIHLREDFENMKRGKLADISLLAATLRKSSMKRTQSNITNNLSGDNARINIDSTDNSINIARSKVVFEEARQAVEKIEDPAVRAAAIEELSGMEAAAGKPEDYLPRYAKFVSLIASHSTLFANLIPKLAELAG